MTMREAMRQMPAAERAGVGQGEALSDPGSDEATRPRHETESTGSGLLDAVLARENLQQALKRVRANKGAAGVDGLDIDQTAEHLRSAWPEIREQLLSGTYRPSPVRRVMIPKPDGGERELGIPTVTDRLIQQALLQVLQPILTPPSASTATASGRADVRTTRCLPRNVCPVGPADRGGRGPGEILRPGQSRHPDRPRSETHRRRRSDPADPRLSEQRHHAGWRGAGASDGHAARRARCRRCWPTCCSMKWIRNWNGEATASCATPTMRTSMCAVGARANG